MDYPDPLSELFQKNLIWVARSSFRSPPCLRSPLGPEPTLRSPLWPEPSLRSAQGPNPSLCSAQGPNPLLKEPSLPELRSGSIHEFIPCFPLAEVRPRVALCEGGQGPDPGLARARDTKSGFPPLSILSLLATKYYKIGKFIVWIGQECWPTPHILRRTGLVIEHNLFLKPPTDKLRLWAIDLTLRSPNVAVVIANCPNLSFANTKRFALAAQKSSALGFLIRPTKALNTLCAATSRWRISPLISKSAQPAFKLELLKYKGRPPQQSEWQIKLGPENENLSMPEYPDRRIE